MTKRKSVALTPKQEQVRLPIKKETASRLNQLQREFELITQQGNAVIETARRRVADQIEVICSENGIVSSKVVPVEVTSKEPFELVLDVQS